MALDKLVDSTQLDSDLTSVANAIRTKGGTSAQLAFPSGFVSAIGDIPSGGGPTPEVPTGYTQLKYVASSGAQAINTGITPNLETKLQIQGSFLNGNGGYHALGGCTNPGCSPGAPGGVRGAPLYFSFGNIIDQTITGYATTAEEVPVFCVDKSGAKVSIDGFPDVTKSFSASAMSGDANTRIFLFARGNAGNYDRCAKCRIYRAKIWDSDTLVRDFVPALRNADDVIGMYDIVNSVFYTNDGTGVFTGGTY